MAFRVIEYSPTSGIRNIKDKIKGANEVLFNREVSSMGVDFYE